jgi:hypothetical protein
MTSRDFCYWLQGFLEISKPESLTKEQLHVIHKHLSLVFVHEIDPSFGDEQKQSLLNKIHKEEQLQPKNKPLSNSTSKVDPFNTTFRC